MILPLVNPTSTFFVGLPFGFIWRRALALVGGDDHDDHDDDGDDDEDEHKDEHDQDDPANHDDA